VQPAEGRVQARGRGGATTDLALRSELRFGKLFGNWGWLGCGVLVVDLEVYRGMVIKSRTA
jgi:hypothetical protein